MNVDQVVAHVNSRIDSEKLDLETRLSGIEGKRAGEIAKAVSFMEGVAALEAAGFVVRLWGWDPTFTTLQVELKDLGRVCDAIGRVTLHSKTVEDAKTRKIRVTLESVKCPSIKISYVKSLPRAKPGQPAPKCRIVRTRRTDVALVCEI